MATIVPYRQQTSSVVGAPDTRRGTLRVDGSNPLAGVAQGIGNYAEKIRVQTTRQELGDVRKRLAMAETEVSKTLLEAGTADLDAEGWQEGVQEQINGAVSSQGNDYTTPEARAAFDTGVAILGQNSLLSVAKMQASRTGKKAALDFQDTQVLKNNIIYEDPEKLGFHIDELRATAEDPNGPLAGMDGAKRQLLVDGAETDMAEAAIAGLVKSNPWQAKRLLDDGAFNEFIDAGRRRTLSSQADSEGRTRSARANALYVSNLMVDARAGKDISAHIPKMDRLVGSGGMAPGQRASVISTYNIAQRDIRREDWNTAKTAEVSGEVAKAVATGDGNLLGLPTNMRFKNPEGGPDLVLNTKDIVESQLARAIQDGVGRDDTLPEAVSNAVARMAQTGGGTKFDVLSSKLEAGYAAGATATTYFTSNKDIDPEDPKVSRHLERALTGYNYWKGLSNNTPMRNANTTSDAASFYNLVDSYVKVGNMSEKDAIGAAALRSLSAATTPVPTSDIGEAFDDSPMGSAKNYGELRQLVTAQANLLNLPPSDAIDAAIRTIKETHRELNGYWFNSSAMDVPPQSVLKYLNRVAVKQPFLNKENAKIMEELGIREGDLMMLPLPGRPDIWSLIDMKSGLEVPGNKFRFSLATLNQRVRDELGIEGFAALQRSLLADESEAETDAGAATARPLLGGAQQ